MTKRLTIELLTETKNIIKYAPTFLRELVIEGPAAIAWLLGKDN